MKQLESDFQHGANSQYVLSDEFSRNKGVDLTYYTFAPEIEVPFIDRTIWIHENNRFELVEANGAPAPYITELKIAPEYLGIYWEYMDMIHNYVPGEAAQDIQTKMQIWESTFFDLLARNAFVAKEWSELDLGKLNTRIDYNYWHPKMRDYLCPLVQEDWRAALCYELNAAINDCRFGNCATEESRRVRAVKVAELGQTRLNAFVQFMRFRSEEKRIAPKMDVYNEEGIPLRLFRFPYFANDKVCFTDRLLPDYGMLTVADAMKIEAAAISRLPDNAQCRVEAEVNFLQTYFSPLM